jgi:hypothetical protein
MVVLPGGSLAEMSRLLNRRPEPATIPPSVTPCPHDRTFRLLEFTQMFKSVIG